MTLIQTPSSEDLLKATQDVFTALADAQRALSMQAYMKHHFVFYGIATPQRRAAFKPLLQSLKGSKADDLIKYAQAFFQAPQRELHYCACAILRQYAGQLNVTHLPALYTLAEQHSWWDSIDSIFPTVGVIVRAEKEAGYAAMDALLLHENFWLRRIAILHQLAWRMETDSARLYRYALHCGQEKEFFIRKAIGWALRDYARHNPESVRSFLAKHGTQLSALSVREAGKHL